MQPRHARSGQTRGSPSLTNAARCLRAVARPSLPDMGDSRRAGGSRWSRGGWTRPTPAAGKGKRQEAKEKGGPARGPPFLRPALSSRNQRATEITVQSRRTARLVIALRNPWAPYKLGTGKGKLAKPACPAADLCRRGASDWANRSRSAVGWMSIGAGGWPRSGDRSAFGGGFRGLRRLERRRRLAWPAAIACAGRPFPDRGFVAARELAAGE